MPLGSEILKKMKRIEIVINEDSLEEMLELLRNVDVRGYTVIKGVGGLGSTGERDPDAFALEQSNAFLVLTCEEAQADKIVLKLQPELKNFGGMCVLTDCHWVLGPKASY
ncbi:nitrogen regulatory protein P-II family [Nitrosomonas sp. PY1]|uniref:P-II family nitrogen regulator n=1 Tax=Nitrosomonas sp. PY1 TaxID=1803906 RepID=UPI001FC89F52|nr:transcriptional regulator [Nitrosomonas sp. PY1]GKS69368.1 nitrogen regulatory protein P-II family [Nitrosomonas sp. PY1]